MPGRIAVLALFALALSAGSVDAQIVSLSEKAFLDGGRRGQPQGNWSVAPDSGPWRVVFDYGVFADGAFQPDPSIAPQGIVKLPAEGTDGTWQAPFPMVLKSPLPEWTVARARLQKKNAQGRWVDDGNQSYTSPPRPAPRKES